MSNVVYWESRDSSSCIINKPGDLKDLSNEVSTNKLGKSFEMRIDLKEYDAQTMKDLEQIAKTASSRGCEVDVLINSKNVDFKMSEMEQFIDLEYNCEKENIGVYFDEGLDQYTLNDTLSAQAQIEEIVDKINSTKASPLEKYMMAYNYVTSKVYKENKKNPAKSRDLTAIFNGDDIVCVGYAKLMNRICKGIGVKSYAQASSVYNDKEQYLGGHQNNIVYLKDDKYGIDGYYYSDACWDSVKKPDQFKRAINHCLIPLGDKDKFKGVSVEIDETNRTNVEGINLKYFYGETPEKYKHKRESYTYQFQERFPEENDRISAETEAMLMSDKKRALACDSLSKILKKANIPANAYALEDSSSIKLPTRCSYNYLMALMLQNPPSVEEVAESIKELQKYVKNQQTGVKLEDDNYLKTTSVSKVDDIYEYIDMLSKETSKRKYTSFSVNDGYTRADVIAAKDDKEKLKAMGFKSVVTERETFPMKWWKVLHECESMAIAEFEVERINQIVNPGEAIPVSTFKRAIKNSLVAQGLDEETAEFQSALTIDSTVQYSEKIFKEDAKNAFRQEALNKRKEQNGEQFGQ